jgi:hypothetical protein
MCLSGNGGAPQEFVNGYWEIRLVFAIRVVVATLLGAVGCLIGSVTALAVLLGDWIDALGERRCSAREAQR